METNTIVITETNFPVLMSCMNEIRYDIDLRPIKSYVVKPSYKVWNGIIDGYDKFSFNLDDVQNAESALKTLSSDDLSEFAYGDHDIKMDLIQKNPNLKIADDILTAFFIKYF